LKSHKTDNTIAIFFISILTLLPYFSNIINSLKAQDLLWEISVYISISATLANSIPETVFNQSSRAVIMIEKTSNTIIVGGFLLSTDDI